MNLVKPAKSFSILLLTLLITAFTSLLLNADTPNTDRTESTNNIKPIDHNRIVNADAEPGNWLSHGRDYAEQRYSPLNSITDNNVNALALSWHMDTQYRRGLEATPIVIDGVMYVTGAWSTVYALDAVTGKQLWFFDPRVPRAEVARKMCCDAVNRGVAVWADKVYVATLDGRLIALNAVNGEVVWKTQTVDTTQSYTITGAPRIIKGNVLIGNSGAEFGVRGYISAYDAESGELNWRFYTVPGNPDLGFENNAMKMAAKTWTGDWWKLGGGGTVWDSMAYDAELDLLYIGVGNGTPWNRRLRSPDGGDNLFLSSIVAVRPTTGEYVWHYQVVPAETWDYTATQHIILADIEIDGALRKVLMQAPKSGFFMLVDRVNGKLISAEPYARVTWASHYDLSTGRPVEVAGQDYAEKPALVRPTSGGAHNWQPMAFNPNTGLVYIPTMDAPMTFTGLDSMEIEPGLRNRGVDTSEAPPGDGLFHKILLKKITSGFLLAWDPVKQQTAWRVKHNTYWNGGLLATAGNLVFQGTGDRQFSAFRADSGEKLWSFKAQNGIIAAPISYSVNGEQYITVLAGSGGAYDLMSGHKPPAGAKHSRVLTFKLNGTDKLPAIPDTEAIPLPPEQTVFDETIIQHGSELYHSYCAFCHGSQVIGGGAIPDLRHMPIWFHDNFSSIVHDGALAQLGMPAFADVFDDRDITALHSYIIERAHVDKALRESPGWLTKIRTSAYNFASSVLSFFLGGSE